MVKERVVEAVVRYRKISVTTLNLPWKQTKTLIFEKHDFELSNLLRLKYKTLIL